MHCQDGLGRAGTRVALYMMKHHGFTAREAMGWLRIVRPGRCLDRERERERERELAVIARSCRRRCLQGEGLGEAIFQPQPMQQPVAARCLSQSHCPSLDNDHHLAAPARRRAK